MKAHAPTVDLPEEWGVKHVMVKRFFMCGLGSDRNQIRAHTQAKDWKTQIQICGISWENLN